MGNATQNRIINVYSSSGDDLMNWKYEGVAFKMPVVPQCNGNGLPGRRVGANPDLPLVCYADRCKVIERPGSSPNRFIMWCKSKPFTSVSTASTPTGPFTLLNLLLPGGHETGDISVYADSGGGGTGAYLVLSVHPSSYGFSHNDSRQLKIFQLSQDWTNVSDTVAERNVTPRWPLPNKYDGKLEAPVVFKPSDAEYAIWASHCTYWFPNDAYLLTSPSLLSGTYWTPAGNPTNNDTSYGTQSTDIVRVTPSLSTVPRSGGAGSTAAPSRAGRVGGSNVPAAAAVAVNAKWVYVADQFEPYITQNTTGRYVWLPIEQDPVSGKLVVNWYDEWTLA